MDLRVAAYAVIERRGKILLTHWRRGHLHGWTLPGGGIEAGEDPRDAVVREVLEETGLHARVGRLVGVDSRVMVREEVPEGTAPELHTIRIVYRATVQDGPLRHEVGGSSDEARWVSLKDLGSLKTLSLVQTGLRFAGISRRSGGGNGGGSTKASAVKTGTAKSGVPKSGAPKSGTGKSSAGRGGQAKSGSTKANATKANASKSGGKNSGPRTGTGRSRGRGRGTTPSGNPGVSHNTKPEAEQQG